ncbi:MAG TPA: bifunctional glycosyltransferase family 2 protein/CDP-glycerol:glycerophosphate glycerophosphotransferase [Actinoplanes sp.]|nr:bifunctional glycosyltransferase family 2 protein/CDP-glycerol:glycerophosphate glycerophosphotransferase [Actinoplanes sp.]
MADLISVVVLAYGVQGYLTECLDSILREQSVDAEVIAIDDASPDHSGAVLDERAAIDPRLTVVHLDRHAGPAAARRAGLERATGDYVWFVDGADHLVPGALAAIRAELADRPDMLRVGLARERWNRKVSLWKPGNPPISALVIRRALLAAAGSAIEADAVLAAAATTATLDAACVIHRLDDLWDRPARGRRGLRAGVRKAAKRWYYRWQLTRPIDDKLAVYAAYWYRGYACNPAAIYEKAKELAPDVRGLWVVKPGNADTMPKGVDYVVSGSRAYYRAIARARWLINNATFPPEVVKRPGSVHVQTHHGTPLKTMGLDQPKFPASTVGFDIERMRRNIAKWDFSITANRHTTLWWDRQFPIRGETLETGYPRNDRLARATTSDTDAARAGFGIQPGERVVLYAPTHREWHATYTPVLDVDRLAEALGPDTRILLRGHYYYGSIGFPPRHPRVIDVSTYPTVEDLYLASDVLITDFSSAMFDYAVLNRPLVVFAPDWDIYRAVRGVTFDLSAEPPGVFARGFDELVAAFRSGAVDGPDARAKLARFRERFCALEDGHAAERVVRRVFLGEPLPVGRNVHADV